MRYTVEARRTLDAATKLASEFGHSYLGTDHLAVALLSVDGTEAVVALKRLRVRTAQLRDTLRRALPARQTAGEVKRPMVPRLKRVLDRAARLAQGMLGLSAPRTCSSHCFRPRARRATRLHPPSLRQRTAQHTRTAWRPMSCDLLATCSAIWRPIPMPERPNQAMQLTASKPAVYASRVCRHARMLRSMHRGLAAADLVSR
jgi:hypothetical protein